MIRTALTALVVLIGIVSIVVAVAGIVLPATVSTIGGAVMIGAASWIIVRADDADVLDGVDADA